jgi:hypothetical protein
MQVRYLTAHHTALFLPPTSTRCTDKLLYETVHVPNIHLYSTHDEGQNSSRYIDWLWAGQPRGWSLSPSRANNFLFSILSRPALGPIHPPIQWVLGAVSPGVKQPRHEADHSPKASAEVKKMWVYRSNPLYAFMA